MPTLITVGRRHCNASCYNAIRPRCHCVCNAMNHSQGQKEAITRTINSSWKLIRHHGRKNIRIDAKEQLEMFPGIL